MAPNKSDIICLVNTSPKEKKDETDTSMYYSGYFYYEGADLENFSQGSQLKDPEIVWTDPKKTIDWDGDVHDVELKSSHFHFVIFPTNQDDPAGAAYVERGPPKTFHIYPGKPKLLPSPADSEVIYQCIYYGTTDDRPIEGLKGNKKTTEEAILKAEKARCSAEEARLKVENAKLATEEARLKVEKAKLATETAKLQAEGDRSKAELAKLQAEGDRSKAEVARSQAEGDRSKAEVARLQAETARSKVEEVLSTSRPRSVAIAL